MQRLRDLWRRLRLRFGWLDHLVRAYAQYKTTQGDHQAAAITFFSFLSIFPILILAVSVLGFVLAGHDDLRDRFILAITENLPGNTVTPAQVDKLVAARGATGVVGLVTLALTGSSWVDNIRSAMETVWGRRPSTRNFLLSKGADLLVLVMLGITLAVSFGLTGFGTTLTGVLLSPLGLADAAWASALALAVGLLLAVAWDTVAFTVILLRLPRVEVTRRSAAAGSLLAAVGFEGLKTGGSYYLASLGNNAAVAGFGSIVGLLIWLMLVSRFLLFCAAWTATFPREGGTSPVLAVVEAGQAAEEAGAGEPAVPVGQPAAGAGATSGPVPSPAAVGAGLFGAGAAVGALGVGVPRVYRRLRRRR